MPSIDNRLGRRRTLYERLGRKHVRIELEADSRDAVDPNPRGQLPADIRSRSLQRDHRFRGILCVAERRYEHDGLPEIRRNRHMLHGDEADGRVVQVTLDDVAYFTRDLRFNPLYTARSDGAASRAMGAVLRCDWPR